RVGRRGPLHGGGRRRVPPRRVELRHGDRAPRCVTRFGELNAHPSRVRDTGLHGREVRVHTAWGGPAHRNHDDGPTTWTWWTWTSSWSSTEVTCSCGGTRRDCGASRRPPCL